MCFFVFFVFFCFLWLFDVWMVCFVFSTVCWGMCLILLLPAAAVAVVVVFNCTYCTGFGCFDLIAASNPFRCFSTFRLCRRLFTGCFGV